MNRPHSSSLAPSLLTLLCSFLWLLLGSPLTAAEWRALPGQLSHMLPRLPGTMLSVFRLWMRLEP